MKVNPESNGNSASTEELRLGLQKSEYSPVDILIRLECVEGTFAHVAEAIFVVELDGRIIEVNLAASTLLGYSRMTSELTSRYAHLALLTPSHRYPHNRAKGALCSARIMGGRDKGFGHHGLDRWRVG